MLKVSYNNYISATFAIHLTTASYLIQNENKYRKDMLSIDLWQDFEILNTWVSVKNLDFELALEKSSQSDPVYCWQNDKQK